MLMPGTEHGSTRLFDGIEFNDSDHSQAVERSTSECVVRRALITAANTSKLGWTGLFQSLSHLPWNTKSPEESAAMQSTCRRVVASLYNCAINERARIAINCNRRWRPKSSGKTAAPSIWISYVTSPPLIPKIFAAAARFLLRSACRLRRPVSRGVGPARVSPPVSAVPAFLQCN